VTLVVCKNIEGNIQFHSDTRVCHNSVSRVFEGTIKVVPITSHLCVAYAGTVQLAHRAIKRLQTEMVAQPTTADERVVEILRHASSDGVEFIAASLAHKEGRIWCIRDGQVEPSASTAWIGDAAAFGCFQRTWLENAHLVTSPLRQSRLFTQAFNSVMESELATVGDFQISVGSRVGHFRYGAYWRSVFPRQAIGPGETPLVLGDSSAGGYSLSCIRLVGRDSPGVALYIQPGRIGILFLPTRTFDMVPIYDLDERAFVSHVRSNYEVTLQGMITLSDGSQLHLGDEPLEGSVNFAFEGAPDGSLVINKVPSRWS
jgi:hypothetical protein